MDSLILMAGQALVVALVTSLIWIWYNGQRLYEINRDHTKDMAVMQDEYDRMKRMVDGVEIQARVLGSVPVSRLIEGGE